MPVPGGMLDSCVNRHPMVSFNTQICALHGERSLPEAMPRICCVATGSIELHSVALDTDAGRPPAERAPALLSNLPALASEAMTVRRSKSLPGWGLFHLIPVQTLLHGIYTAGRCIFFKGGRTGSAAGERAPRSGNEVPR